ncbi:unnamed protein product [Echinostoma caproni]|uniref:Uncharacterized protein n=1 Tax=Echinostoma caproni TaxID=27848 RepID=A0A183BD06_9TREM|nr:unnamed protein product [Echinostoma caproni]
MELRNPWILKRLEAEGKSGIQPLQIVSVTRWRYLVQAKVGTETPTLDNSTTLSDMAKGAPRKHPAKRAATRMSERADRCGNPAEKKTNPEPGILGAILEPEYYFKASRLLSSPCGTFARGLNFRISGSKNLWLKTSEISIDSF